MHDYEKTHSDTIRSLGGECTVLLRSNGAFPLPEPCEIALYGSGARRTVKGGTGSGEVNSRYMVSAEEGLKNAGFTILTKDWLDTYDTIRTNAKQEFICGLHKQASEHHTLAVFESMGAVMPEPEYEIPFCAENCPAVYVLSRICGEGSDRRPVPGDILLTETEIRDINALDQKYSPFMLVLNTGGPVDLSPVKDVSNILILSQLGAETGNILADLILGRSVPSGKLTTTWSVWEDYARIGTFGERDDTLYQEGIYVGYRYFDSVGKKALFPFGHGLGYTAFGLNCVSVKEAAGTITLRASVRNTGKYIGKEIAQLYVSLPQGRLDQPYQVLAAFAKSKELLPQEEEELTLTFDLRDLASYDKTKASWILEAGDYILRLGNSSTETTPAAVLRISREIIVRTCRNCFTEPWFTDWKPQERTEEHISGVPILNISTDTFITRKTDYALREETEPLIETLSDAELAYLNIGAFDPNLGPLSIIGNASKSVAGAAGETTSCLKEKGIPVIVVSDGPAGLRLSRQYTRDTKGVHAVGETIPESVMELLPKASQTVVKTLSGNGKVKGEILEQNCTAIPIGTALAQSWDPQLAEKCGDIVGDEMERFGIHLWLAPALNIHRDIRCGRNFEYYSEDPLISGKIAAAVIRGVQKHAGCGAVIKHFAANNQETNRQNSNSQVSERTLREIYLRGFEIALRESSPCAVMTSYNLINGIHTSENRYLIQDILRAEFGFQGIVMTDWIVSVTTGGKNRYPGPDCAKIAAAGNDLTMPGSQKDFRSIMNGLRNGTVTRKQLQINASRVYRAAAFLMR